MNSMKEKILTAISTLMIFVPWTILPLRTFPWALLSPTAEIIISCYIVFMVFSGIFTVFAYKAGRVRHTWMKLCVVINSLYGVAGIVLLILMLS